jgi:hypothetical protein
MSQTPVVLLILLLASGVAEPLALAEGATLAAAELTLTPSRPPDLLGTTLLNGRTGWRREAELAAASPELTSRNNLRSCLLRKVA